LGEGFAGNAAVGRPCWRNPQFFNQLPRFGLSARCEFFPLNSYFLQFIDLNVCFSRGLNKIRG